MDLMHIVYVDNVLGITIKNGLIIPICDQLQN